MPEVLKDYVSLPLEESGKAELSVPSSPTLAGRSWWQKLLFAGLLLGLGMIGGIYMQPLADLIVAAAGVDAGGSPVAGVLEQGGGRSAVDENSPDVVALGHLVPNGGVLAVALPYGAGDAHIARLLVNEGDLVEAGQIVAELDNMPALLAARASAETNVKAQKASMEQVRSTMLANLAESRANHAAAAAALTLANQDLERQTKLAASNVTTQVLIEQARASAVKARSEFERTAALVARYNGAETGSQSDILLAERNLELARTTLTRSTEDLASGRVVAPRAGSVLEIHTRVGEKPSDKGVMTIGDLTRMTAELEVYQTEVAKVGLGQMVSITGGALPEPLTGRVTRIGQIVGRQSVMSSEPAANADARVVKVIVTLDSESSINAQAFTNLEVIGRIRTRAE